MYAELRGAAQCARSKDACRRHDEREDRRGLAPTCVVRARRGYVRRALRREECGDGGLVRR